MSNRSSTHPRWRKIKKELCKRTGHNDLEVSPIGEKEILIEVTEVNGREPDPVVIVAAVFHLYSGRGVDLSSARSKTNSDPTGYEPTQVRVRIRDWDV